MSHPAAPLRRLPGRPLVVGHRGAPGETPERLENKLPSFQAALDAGADAVELDVRMTADDVPVVVHDADLRRTHNERVVIARQPASHLPVPRLADVLRFIQDGWPGRAVDVELKVHVPPDRLGAVMDEAGWNGPTLVTSFLPRTVRSYSRSGWTTGILVESRRMKREGARTFLATTEADVLAVANPIFPGQMRDAAHDAGAAVWVFTLNREASLRKAYRHRIDAVITDFPAKALGLYTRLAREPGTPDGRGAPAP